MTGTVAGANFRAVRGRIGRKRKRLPSLVSFIRPARLPRLMSGNDRALNPF